MQKHGLTEFSYSVRKTGSCRYDKRVSRPVVGNLFTIIGRMNCALLLAGRKIN